MSAKIIRLQPESTKLRVDQADQLRQALLPFEDEIPHGALRALLWEISRRTTPTRQWTFVMLSPVQNTAVVGYLAERSDRPIQAMKLWAICFEVLDHETGEILLTRAQLADRISAHPRVVTRIMGELETCGAISRRRESIFVRYFMNPNVATHLSGEARDNAQVAAPNITKL